MQFSLEQGRCLADRIATRVVKRLRPDLQPVASPSPKPVVPVTFQAIGHLWSTTLVSPPAFLSEHYVLAALLVLDLRQRSEYDLFPDTPGLNHLC